MSLHSFFRINLPYGIAKNAKGHWAAFNREYVNLGRNDNRDNIDVHRDLIYTSYPDLTDQKVKEIFGESYCQYDADGKLVTAFFYDDRSNPTNMNTESAWRLYFAKLKTLSGFEQRKYVMA
ncbi:MAG: hypothetical protein RLO17_07325 [Cyclobacteriaceae bacterium]|jgi:hypothetical protein